MPGLHALLGEHIPSQDGVKIFFIHQELDGFDGSSRGLATATVRLLAACPREPPPVHDQPERSSAAVPKVKGF